MTEYAIELEIFEGSGGEPRPDGACPDFAREGICAWMHYAGDERPLRVGDRFRYPDDLGGLCPWLLDSLTGVIRALEHGGTLPWRYRGTAFEKVIDPAGVTTEFVRCLDPTSSGIVVKVIRTALPG